MPSLSRRKGADFERYLCNVFRDIYPNHRVCRGQQGMGGVVPDVDIPDYWVEAKRGRRPSPIAALKQAIRDTDGRTPVAIIRDDRSQAFVVYEWDGIEPFDLQRGRTIRMCLRESDPCRCFIHGYDLVVMSLALFLHRMAPQSEH